MLGSFARAYFARPLVYSGSVVWVGQHQPILVALTLV